MKPDVWYVLHEMLCLLEERYDEEEGLFCYSLVQTNERSMATHYPNTFHAELAISRAKEYGIKGKMIPVCFGAYERS